MTKVTNTTVRMTPDQRKAVVLHAAVEAARKYGYATMGLREVADIAECSHPLILRYYRSISELRDAVVERAVKTKDYAVLAQALVNNHPRALALSKKTKEEIRAAI